MSDNRSAGGGLDLHGYSVAEAIERFVEQYNQRVKNGQCGCWTIVHGYGSSGEGGVIRTKLRAFLDQHLDKLRYEPGDNYGRGWKKHLTWVEVSCKPVIRNLAAAGSITAMIGFSEYFQARTDQPQIRVKELSWEIETAL